MTGRCPRCRDTIRADASAFRAAGSPEIRPAAVLRRVPAALVAQRRVRRRGVARVAGRVRQLEQRPRDAAGAVREPEQVARRQPRREAPRRGVAVVLRGRDHLVAAASCDVGEIRAREPLREVQQRRDRARAPALHVVRAGRERRAQRAFHERDPGLDERVVAERLADARERPAGAQRAGVRARFRARVAGAPHELAQRAVAHRALVGVAGVPHEVREEQCDAREPVVQVGRRRSVDYAPRAREELARPHHPGAPVAGPDRVAHDAARDGVRARDQARIARGARRVRRLDAQHQQPQPAGKP